MTDYKALYEAQLEENKELKEQIHDIWAEQRETEENFEEEKKKLKEENKKLLNSKNDLYNELEELTQKIETLKQEKKTLLKSKITNVKTLQKEKKETKEKLQKVIKYLEDTPGVFKCGVTGKILTEDDIYMSVEYGHLLCEEAIDENMKTYQELEKENNVRKDIIYNLFSQRLSDDNVLDDGIDLSKEYGQKYIDEWNKIHEEIFDDVVKTMNMCEYDFEHFHIEYNGDKHFDLCMNETDDEEEEEEENKNVCYDCKKDISFCRTIDSIDYCLKCAVKHEKDIEEQ